MSLRRKQILIILVIFLTLVVADQVSKAVIRARVPLYQGLPDPQHPKFFQISHQTNPGLVGGMFREKPVLAFVSPILATLVLLYLYRYLEPASKLQSLAFGLIAGGALGNLIDRLWKGEVTDWLQFQFYFIPFDFPWKDYPAFNFADTGICTGVFLLIVTWYILGAGDQASDKPAAEKSR